MAPRRLAVDELASVLPAGGLTLVSSCSAESRLLGDMVAAAAGSLGDMAFSGIFVPRLNRLVWDGGPQTRVITFFQTQELRAEGERVDFLPLNYGQIVAFYRRHKPQAALFMCSPPDAQGNCSFGTECAFIADMWRDIPVRIAHINPLMPRTPGDKGIPFSEITAVVEAEQDLLGIPAASPDAVAQAIAAQVAEFVSDGATLQTGLGRIPDAVLDALHDRRGLRLHTGLLGDGGLRLLRSGAMAEGRSALVGVAIGSPELYAGLDDPHLQFRPVSSTHHVALAGAADALVTINSAIEADLFGQCYAEVGPKGAMSGPGGASDFAAAARLSPGGKRIVAFPASAAGGTVSRIVLPQDATGPVSLGRMDVDIIVTEHGAADLRGKSHEARAKALIAIAAPDHRETLAAGWCDIAARL